MEVTLTWKVDVQESVPCPDVPRPDPYTGERSMMGCLVAHLKTVTREMSKTFSGEIEAEEFKKNAPSNCYDWKTLKEITNETSLGV